MGRGEKTEMEGVTEEDGRRREWEGEGGTKENV